MTDVPYLELRRELHALRRELRRAFDSVLDAGVLFFGPQTEALERALCQALGVRHAAAVASGTSALQVALLAHGIGPGDEVITTPASFYSTAKAIELVGATPVFVDVDPDHYLLQPELARQAVTSRTRAILPVHLYGYPAPLPELRALADRMGLVLIEDAAQAFGAQIGGLSVGAWGDSTCLSFYPTKNVGALGDAGAVLTDDLAVAEAARAIRFLGWKGQRDHFAGHGLLARIDELQAAVLLVKVAAAGEALCTRRRLAGKYDQRLSPALRLPPTPQGLTHAHHLYVIRSPRRDELFEALRAAGIGCEIHYRVPLHRQPRFAGGAPRLPNAERWAREVLSLPLYPYLRPEEQERVITEVNRLAG